MLTNKQIVITGCAGFIGSRLTELLCQSGNFVYGIDNLTYAANVDWLKSFIKNNQEHFTFLEADICELKSIPNCDFIINLAAESHVDNSIKDHSKFIKTNVDGVANLLSLVTNSIFPNKPIFIQMSTDEVYGDCADNEGEAFTEEDGLNPSSPYAASKAAADLLIQSWARTYGLEYKLIRPSNNYGIRQYPEKLIPLAVKQLDFNRKIYLHNNGDPIRTWTHVDDTCYAIIDILERGTYNIYNISSEFELQNRYVVRGIIYHYLDDDEVDVEQFINYSYSRPGQDHLYRIDINRIHSELGWYPKANFDIELEKCVKYYKGKVIW